MLGSEGFNQCGFKRTTAKLLNAVSPLTLGGFIIVSFASPVGANDSVLDEIIVSAEKRDENLQELSQAVTVFTGENLDVQNVRSFIDLSALAPGVTATTNGDYRLSLSIRGIGNEGNQNNIVNPSVSFHLDGVYVVSQFMLKTDFLDIAQVEVLRGPQGTLFGQNSIGGAINITTQKPDFETYSGKADIAFGSYDLLNIRSTVNMPFGDKFAIRGSVSFIQQEGTTKNIATSANNTNFDQFSNVAGFEDFDFLGMTSPSGQTYDDLNNVSWRIRSLWRPIENFELDLAAQQFQEDTNGAAGFGLDDATPLRDRDNNRQVSQDSPSDFYLDAEIYNAQAKLSLPSVTIKALGSFQRADIAQAFDNDRSEGAFVSSFVLTNASLVETYVGELNFVSARPLFEKLDWVAGGFYFNQQVDFEFLELLDLIGTNGDPSTLSDGEFDPFDSNDFLSGFAPPGTDLGFQTQSFLERESFSFYGQGTYALTDKIDIIGGVRYTDDAVESNSYNFFTLPNGLAPVLSTQGDTAFTGRFAIEYLSPAGQLFYASYTRGFKPGGINLTFGLDGDAAAPVVPQSFGPESVNAYEIGVKGDYLNGRLRANLAAYFNDYSNLQFQATDPNVFQGGIDSIPSSEIYGAEGEFVFALTDHFQILANVAYTHSQITQSFLALDNVASNAATNALLAGGEFLFGPVIEAARAAELVDVQGNALAKTPRFTNFVSLDYTYPLVRGEVFTSFQWVRRGAFQQRIFNNPNVDEVGAYNQLNFLVSYDDDRSGLGVEFAVRNITNVDGVNSRFTDVFGVGATQDYLIPPRQFVGRLKYRFN